MIRSSATAAATDQQPKNDDPAGKSWFVYLLECAGGSVYTGIAVDVEQRLQLHLAGKGARYTRMHRPLRILAQFEFKDRGSASRAEYLVKQLSAQQKRQLAAQGAGRTATDGRDAPLLAPIRAGSGRTVTELESATPGLDRSCLDL